jgi:HPt (histidine-containing phosphotransfer) domain-containing protein
MTSAEEGGVDAAELPSLDPSALDRLKRFGGAKLLGEMIALFLTAAPQRIGAARAATEAGDAPATELAMHSLKSSSAQLGAMRMQRLCEQGEQLARAGNLLIVGFLVQDLEDEFVRVTEWLERAQTGGVV